MNPEFIIQVFDRDGQQVRSATEHFPYLRGSKESRIDAMQRCMVRARHLSFVGFLLHVSMSVDAQGNPEV